MFELAYICQSHLQIDYIFLLIIELRSQECNESPTAF